ncbi:barstar family protein [Nonomuraea sp. NPDC049714]|uniref:barstar family protein n=1 Tax=Nonomuraea sp. NPDC049714 TaxID=3364357 RepID=UPI00378AE21D
MAYGAKFPMYRIVDEESGDVLVAAENVRGFFVEQESESMNVAFLGVHQVNKAKHRVENAYLEIANYRHEKIGEYYVGRVARTGTDVEFAVDDLPSISFYFGALCEYPRAGKVWQRWASEDDLRRDEWVQWPLSYHETWLHVVQNSWFASLRRAARYEYGETVYLDGSKIATKPGFYCALGEAMNGPGGYFGSNLDAVAECISSGLEEAPPAQIVWRNFQFSRTSLGNGFVDAILALMCEFDIEVVAR